MPGAAVIRVFADLEALSRGAAELFVANAAAAVAARGRFSVALSGGSTPRSAYEALARPPFWDSLDWSRTHVFWGDERCVAEDDSRRNARMAREALLNHVPIPAAQVHPMDCRPSPEEGARSYEALLRNFFGQAEPRFDLVLLGLGPDGHTASLFRGAPALAETVRWVAPVYVAEQDLYRLTLTAPLLNQGRAVVFLVAGAAKAAVVREVLGGPREPRRLPAQLIQPVAGELYWLLDEAAAAALDLAQS
jgi:6-phosphogluconolactonase